MKVELISAPEIHFMIKVAFFQRDKLDTGLSSQNQPEMCQKLDFRALCTLSYLLREQDVISEQGGKFSQNSLANRM